MNLKLLARGVGLLGLVVGLAGRAHSQEYFDLTGCFGVVADESALFSAGLFVPPPAPLVIVASPVIVVSPPSGITFTTHYSPSVVATVPDSSNFLSGIWGLSLVGMFVCRHRSQYLPSALR